MSAGAMHIYQHQKQRQAQDLARSRQRWAEEERAQKLEDFCDAAKDGNLAQVKSLIHDVNIDKGCKAYTGKPTALFLAAQAGKTDVVRYLLEQGASVDKAEETMGKTPLWDAAHNDHLETVKVLVEHKAGLEIKNSEGKTPLAIAASRGNAKIVAYLIQQRANKEVLSNAGTTPLAAAIFAGKIVSVAALLEGGAYPMQTTREGFSVLYIAAQENQLEIAQLLLEKKADVHFGEEKTGNSPLSMAASNGHIKMAELLLKHHAEINPKSGVIPIFTAINQNQEAMVRYLVCKKANLNPQNLPASGKSPLMHAAFTGKIKMLGVLLSEGAQIDLANRGHMTALMYAIIGNQPAAVSFLTSRGASLHYERPANAPLLNAINKDFPEVVKALHEAGVDIHQPFEPLKERQKPGVYHDTPLNLALVFQKTQSASMLYELGAMPAEAAIGGPLSHVLIRNKEDRTESLSLLLEKQPDCVNDNHQGTFLIHLATQNEKTSYLELLLKYHVTLQVANSEGQTPLHIAVELGRVEHLKLLLGSDKSAINEKNLEGQTPLHLSALHGQLDCLQLLLDSGADPYQLNEKGEDLIWLCCSLGEVKAIQLLLAHHFDLTKNQSAYQNLATDTTFEETTTQARKSKMKSGAIAITLAELDQYDALPKSSQSKSRGDEVSQLRSSLQGLVGEEKELDDVLGAIEHAIGAMTKNKSYGWRGLKHSKLYIGLTNAQNQINNIKNVVNIVLHEDELAEDKACQK